MARAHQLFLVVAALALMCFVGVALADTCEDGIRNCPSSCERGIDCGGPCPDCPTCFDDIKNGDETDIDVGGSCHSCSNGKQDGLVEGTEDWEEGVDCGWICPACPTCSNGVQDGDETGVDCGGSCLPDKVCPTCTDGLKNGDEGAGCGNEDWCKDCGGSCSALGLDCPTCEDGLENGDETSVDCGGSCGACPTCEDGLQNGDENWIDCGGSCEILGKTCPSCDDRLQNGDETGVDCGGSCSLLGKPCPTCADGLKNGDETGVDCGGSCNTPCPTCEDGLENGDEAGIDCGGSCPVYRCPTCADSIRNGDETGIDCGGSCSTACPETCDDGLLNGLETEVDCGGPDCECCKPTCNKKFTLGYVVINFTLCADTGSAQPLRSHTLALEVVDWLRRAGSPEYLGPEDFPPERLELRSFEFLVGTSCTRFEVYVWQPYSGALGAVDQTARWAQDIAQSLKTEMMNQDSLSLGSGFTTRTGFLYTTSGTTAISFYEGTHTMTQCVHDEGLPVVSGSPSACPGYEAEEDEFPFVIVIAAVAGVLAVVILGYLFWRCFLKKQDITKANSMEMVARDQAENELDEVSDEDEDNKLV